MTEHNTTGVLIVGAGLSGLMAAHVLHEQGVPFIIADKGVSVGGRLATRRIGAGRADHGAQFFTVRTDVFRLFVDQWIADGLVYEWSRGWSDGSLKGNAPDGYPRYACKGGMNALAAHLARGLGEIHVNVAVKSLCPFENGWEAVAENSNTYRANALLLTPPIPQSLALLNEGGTVLDPDQQIALEAIQYGPCLCGLFHVEGDVNLPEPGALQTPAADISWIADNQRKGISPDAKLITVHAGVKFSKDHWKKTDDEALSLLRAALETHFAPGATIKEAQLKRWRYAVPLATYPEPSLMAKNLPPLVFAGDAFGGHSRVEGAALSGLDAGKVLAEQVRD
jgi:renalase